MLMYFWFSPPNPVFFFFLIQARALLQTASSLGPHMYEPHFNFATVSDKVLSLSTHHPVGFFFFPGFLKKYRWIRRKINKEIIMMFWKKWFLKYCMHLSFTSRESLINFKEIYHWIWTKLTIIDCFVDCYQLQNYFIFKIWHLGLKKILIK